MHVVLNMACSVDGRVGAPDGSPIVLSGKADLARVHRLRARSDAVLVGVGTVLADDPQLTARTDPPPGKPPLRVVLDSQGRTPEQASVLDDQAPTLVLTTDAGPKRLGDAMVETLGDEITPDRVLDALEGKGVDHLLVEGGPRVAASFLDAGAVDRFTLYIAPRILGAGPGLPQALDGVELQLEPRTRACLGEGTLLAYGVPP